MTFFWPFFLGGGFHRKVRLKKIQPSWVWAFVCFLLAAKPSPAAGRTPLAPWPPTECPGRRCLEACIGNARAQRKAALPPSAPLFFLLCAVSARNTLPRMLVLIWGWRPPKSTNAYRPCFCGDNFDCLLLQSVTLSPIPST